MRLGRRMILGVAFPLALALLSLNIVAAFLNIRAIGGSVRQSGRSRETLREVASIISTVRAAESGQRGYLLTGQEVYLEPYRNGIAMLASQLDRLESLTEGEPAQGERVTALRGVLGRKREELARTVALRRDEKKNDAIREVRSGLGRRLMNQAQHVAADLENHEQRALTRHTQVSQAAFRKTVRAVVFATFLALALLALAVTLRRGELTERERRVEAIRQSEARLATTVMSIGDAVISTDESGRIQLMNPIAEALTGYSLADAVGRPITEVLQLVNETTRKPAENPAERVIREGVIQGLANHTVLIARDATEIPIDDSAAPIKDASGQVIGVILVFRDITGRRRDEAERERLLAAERVALAEAEEANRAKDQFLAILSHELRTPLNPIMLAVTSMLARPVAPEDIGPALEMIRENVALEARLIDDLLDVMRIARGKMALHTTVVDCHSLIRHALHVCQSDRQGKVLSVVLDLSARDHRVTADATRLEQVFWNLIKNAVKFTPAGGTIEIRSWNESDPEEGDDQLLVEFADTGIGIEPEALPWIFDPFHQGGGSITGRFGGMGLGLAISRGVVEAHGGLLTAESPGKNRGSTFRVRLQVEHTPAPLAEVAPKKPQARDQATPPASLRIFLIEDEPTTLLVMARLLRKLGHDVTTARTVQEALAVAEGADFDVAVSDIGLPDGSGLDLMRQLSANRHLPAIALTGFGMQEDIRRSREAGFAAHLTKPIDFARLITTIRQVAGRPKAPG
jgi:PAS domain S-box-containing protein